ncbi:ankyrin repeat domain-containing protein [Paragemmobacter aquarius]|uniref:hypothetical protein n=1 Tax=Paragemmobacter aquarius TaxID=2169400 RepID=UPI00131EF64E|nr:hypothetical protein [Gemmobacter aquarius]
MWFNAKKKMPDDTKRLLIFLCQKGRDQEACREVERIVSLGYDLAFFDDKSLLTPLLLALDCDTCEPEIAKIIFAASKNAWQRGVFGFTTLHAAAKSQEFIEILEFAIKRTPNIDEPMGEESSNTALGLAAMNLNEQGIVALLQSGASLAAGSGAAAAGWSSTGWNGALKYKSNFHSYLKDDRLLERCLNRLIEGGLQINDSIEHNFRKATMLDAVIHDWNLRGNAIQQSDGDFQARKLNLLLRNGANPSISYGQGRDQSPFSGNTLHICKWSEQIAILLDYGADPYSVDTNGRTVLHAVIGCRDHSQRLEEALLRSNFSRSRLDDRYAQFLRTHQSAPRSLMESLKQAEFSPFIKDPDRQRKIAFLGTLLR